MTDLHRPGTVSALRHPAGAELETALHTLDPGDCTLTECVRDELVVLVLAGRGRLVIDGASQRFCAPCSLLPPVGAEYRVVNDAAEQLMLLYAGACAMPARLATGPATRNAPMALAEPAGV